MKLLWLLAYVAMAYAAAVIRSNDSIAIESKAEVSTILLQLKALT
jgi:hypothetical protein